MKILRENYIEDIWSTSFKPAQCGSSSGKDETHWLGRFQTCPPNIFYVIFSKKIYELTNYGSHKLEFE